MLVIAVLAASLTLVAQQEIDKDIDSSGVLFSQRELKRMKYATGKLEMENKLMKVEVLGKAFQKHFDMLIASEINQNLELVFLIDASSSVGSDNFQSELQFVRKLLADFTISYDKTRVALITFSSVGEVKREVDMMSQPNTEYNKCSVLHHQAQYSGGGTYTLGAMLDAQDIFSYSRLNSHKVLILVTDGFSNGGDPRRVARALKSDGIIIYTFGIHNGNTAELFDMASKPEEEHCYILDSFDEFVGLARRALHRDLSAGVYVPVMDSAQCISKCGSGAICSCGLRTGQYQCLCPPGFYGPATADQKTPCRACPNGTFTSGGVPGDVTLCTPCPDANHMTLKPATGLEGCICKHGFVADGYFCQMVTCPELPVPQNGQFVRSSCGNVVNTSCGFRCDFGYSLIGSSTRLCQPDGKWSGQQTECIIKTCPPLQAPHNGVIVCSPEASTGEDLAVGTECSYSCSAGTELVGSPVRTCLPLARWDGLPTICKPVKCLALPNVTNGVWEPEECRTKKKLPFGQACFIQCKIGFEREGSEIRECGPKGTWTDDKEAVRCVDTMVPNLECPTNITVSTVAGEAYADGITWIVPDPRDNSNQSVLLWSDPPVHPPSIFYIGNTIISYVATDTSYNQAVCQFSISVVDLEPPGIEDCESPPIFLVEGTNRKVFSWADTVPRFIDNSLEELFVNSSHLLEDLPVGTSEVTFTGVDSSGNSNSCVMNYTLIDNGCKQLPLHVIADCAGDFCTLSCEDGYMFASDNVTVIIPHPCSVDVPECLESEEPNLIEQGGRATFTPSTPELCDNSNFLNQVNKSVKMSLVDECNNSSVDCSIRIDAQCEAVIGSAEEESNKLVKRKRRALPQRNVNVNFKITSRIGSKKPQEKLTSHMKGYKLLENMPSIKASKLVLGPLKLICPPGTVLKRNRCVHCPPGTFWREEERNCVACSFGTFQPLPSQQQCLSCPDNTSTRIRHARSVNACRDICPSGTYSRRGMGELGTRPCVSCPVGHFQPMAGALSCLQCPSPTTTSRRRTALLEHCRLPPAPCQPYSCLNGGTCQVKQGRSACICPADYIGSQCEFKKTECQSMPCLYGGTCLDVQNGHVCTCLPGFTGEDCQIDIDECASNPCLNGGECSDLKAGFVCHCPPAFEGALCELNVDDCLARPCAEASSCVDLAGNYSCACRPGYSGRSCQLDPCLSNVCHNNGLCHLSDNLTHPYWCECEPGFKGVHCEEVIDPCSPSPCLNNGTCLPRVPRHQSASAQCTCTPGFMGEHCETRILSNFTLFFASSGTLNYAIVEGPQLRMNELTVCLWMQTNDRFNYGTIFSYATINDDNTLTLTDYNGLVLYVNGERVVTDVTANDGVWHQICFEWTSVDGQWMLYKDGILRDRGIGLSNGTNIPGGGVLVLGQDQDSVGGGFNAAESLVGGLAQVNLWDHRLGAGRIRRLATQCSAQQDEGNLLKWAQFRAGVRGTIQIGESPFCQGCGNLTIPPNTKIELSPTGDMATYTCDLGYSMKVLARFEIYKVERRCMIYGKWEGATPLCSKVSCGFPGYFPSGWIIGQSYLYENEIEYVCQGGHRLVGDRFRLCLANGSWSGEAPSCLGGDCPDLFPPENGKMWAVYQDSYKLEFECDVGYEMLGNPVLICLSNKTWTNHPPECNMKTCKYANNASVDVLAGPGTAAAGGNSFYLGTLVQISCPKGFRSDEDPYKMTCGDSGWYPPPPTQSLNCSKVLCPPLNVANGSIIADSYAPGARVTVRCDRGFQPQSLVLPVCLEEGRWSGEVGCEPVTCPEMATEHLSLPRSEFGKIATLQCSPGLMLLVAGQPVKEKEVKWECRENGQWVNLTSSPVDPHMLSCIKSCPTPEGPEFGFIVSDTQTTRFYQEGHKVKVQCRQGYSLVGSSYSTCQNNGTWTDNTTCEAVDCGVPPVLGLTRVSKLASTQYSSVARLGCQEGYQIYGDSAVRCQADAKWSRFKGRCVRISCGKPTLDEGVSFIGSAYLFQESLTVICPSGYTLEGEAIITCLKDGKWSSLPKCLQ